MRARLFLVLIVTTGAVWLCAIAWIYTSTKSQVERVLDARLMEAANMVSSLLVDDDVSSTRAAGLASQRLSRPTSYDRQLSCQIWSFAGDLLSKSDAAPTAELTTGRNGFSETLIDGETWRVYAVENKDRGIRVLVGDTRRIRTELVGDVVKGLALPALLIMPILAALIWMSVNQGFAPLNKIAAGLGSRPTSDLSPLPTVNCGTEIRPVVAALNGLFHRLADARQRERNFTSFAAHELRTPLAGLKTQAQIALVSDDPQVRRRALSQIVDAVNRTSRLVRQLLDLAAVEARDSGPGEELVNPGEALAHLRNEFASHDERADRISIADELFEMNLPIKADVFSLAARNLLENALTYSPPGQLITCRLARTQEEIAVIIEDSGPGIPADEIDRVTERFFRGRNKAPVGSGLGLSIAEIALNHAGATLDLLNRNPVGLSAAIKLAAIRDTTGNAAVLVERRTLLPPTPAHDPRADRGDNALPL
jgi:two-component system sensor histidine kinase QseC